MSARAHLSPSRPRDWRVVACLGGLCAFLSGCSNSLDLEVAASIPEPVVTQIPLQVGVYYDEDFRTRIYTENSADREDWRIDTRAARLSLFERVLPRMFESVEEISGPKAPPDSELDAVLHPKLKALQVALPEETHMNFYEAWINYDIRLLEPDGALIYSWDVIGYGKESDTGFFDSRGENLNAAIDTAMRDLGARLILGLPQRPQIRAWLCSQPAPPTSFCAAPGS